MNVFFHSGKLGRVSLATCGERPWSETIHDSDIRGMEDITCQTVPRYAAVGPSENRWVHGGQEEMWTTSQDKSDQKCWQSMWHTLQWSQKTWDNVYTHISACCTWVCCCEYAGGSSVGFMMAGCVFWEGAGVDFWVFPGAACKTRCVNIYVLKIQWIQTVMRPQSYFGS